MDFRNICSNMFDMDAIRAKFPPLPDVMPQLKLPKSMSKLKSRSKIFRSSREDVISEMRRSAMEELVTNPANLAIPTSDFVNHTPQRISTISSLVDDQASRDRGRLPPGASIKRKNPPQQNENFYRSAGGIDDYCPSPVNNTRCAGDDVPMSPSGRATADDKLSFKERMQKGYKDVSDFKLKNIFVKKTVVRQDDISLNHYIDQYSEDRKRRERYEDKMDRAIADNYEFEFKTSRRKSEESFGISTPSDSPRIPKSNTNKKLLSEHSGDESGMELSPPTRNPGIASTRFARVRKVPLRMSLDEDDDAFNQGPRDNDEEEEEEDLPIQNTLHTVMRQKSEDKVQNNSKPSPPKTKSIRKRFGGLTRQISEGQSPENIDSPKKHRAPLSPRQSQVVKCPDSSPPGTRPSSPPEAKQGKPFVAIKENFKRFQKSFKLSTSSLAQSGAESEADEANDKPKQSKTQQFAERLKRFRSVDNVDKQTEDEQEKEDKTKESPMHKFTSKLQDWKKSMKKKPQTHNTEDEDAEDTSPRKREKPVGSLMKKLKHIRSRKNASTDDPDDDEEGGDTYREGFRLRAKLQLERGVAAASQMPQMTMDKIRETKKYFRKTQDKDKDTEPKPKAAKNDSDESDLEEETNSTKKQRSTAKVYPKGKDSGSRPAVTRHYYSSDDEAEEDEYDRQQQGLCKVTGIEPHQPKVLVPLARAAWTNKSIHSDSMDTGDDDDDILPRVLIHQDNSDVFESTIIIAVTRPISRTHSPSPYITELPPDSPKISRPETKVDNWMPSREIISSFREASAPIQRELSKDTITSSSSRGHSRKHSMDSSSEDSWIKDVPRGISIAAGLNSVYEMDESWKVQTGKRDEKLYKTKSIDIFEKTGGLKIFEDFDDELKHTPVVKIEDQPETQIVEIHKRNNVDSFEQDSGEDLEDNPDDDNSSRVTRILKQPEEVKGVDAATPPLKPRDIKLKTHLYGNSTESLMGNLDAKNNSDDEESGEESDDEENADNEEDDENEDEDNDSDDVYKRPPSAAPSSPPSMSPPPPPLPERQPSLRLSMLPKALTQSLISTIPPPPEELPPSPPMSLPPPLPQSKPPLPPNRIVAPTLPKVPERTPSMSKVARPLVKTSSLRLAYNEQVNPKDVGKVNKLISRFEPNSGYKERPRIIPRIPYMSQSSGDYSEDEGEDDSEDNDFNNDVNDNKVEDKDNTQQCDYRGREKSLEKTPTNKPKIQKSFSIDTEELLLPPVNNNPLAKKEELATTARKSTKTNKPLAPSVVLGTSITPTPTPTPTPPLLPLREEVPSPPNVPSIAISTIQSLQSDQNSNFSRPSSEYGSPLAYPSSLMGSTEVLPLSSPKDMVYWNSRRSRRSMTRDDETYFSFDSDEENSYYSIGSTKSNRYVVDL